MASPNISFESIPSSIRKPGAYMEFNTRLAVRTLPSNKQRLLIFGQRMAAGTVAAGVATRVFSDADAGAFFGRGSQLHLMIKAAIQANRYVEITAVAADDAGSSARAVGSLTFAGTASNAGEITVYIGGEPTSVAVPAQTTAADAATSVMQALALQLDLPCTFAKDPGNTSKVDCTAKNAGTVANGLRIDVAANVPGITVSVTQPTGGATNPDFAPLYAQMVAASDEILVVPFAIQAPLTALRTHIDSRSGAIEQRGCIGVYGITGTLSEATTLAGQLNAGRITGAFMPGCPTPSYMVAAAYAAVIASEEDPARPLNNLALTGVRPPALPSRLTRTEQEACLANGVTPLQVGPGEVVQIVRAVTTYTLNAAGALDISLLDLTTIRTLDYVRRSCRERIVLRFPRDKLSQRTPAKVRSELYDVLIKLEELEIVEAVENNKDGLIVERDSQDPNRLNARIPTDVVNGLHVFAGRIDLLL